MGTLGTNRKHILVGLFILFIFSVAISSERPEIQNVHNQFEHGSVSITPEHTGEEEISEQLAEIIGIHEDTIPDATSQSDLTLEDNTGYETPTSSSQSRVITTGVTHDAHALTRAVDTSTQTTEVLNVAQDTQKGRVGKVVNVVDGDTFKISLNNKTETVRIIGIDTPETVHPSKPVECFGAEASNKAKALLTGTTVTLIPEPSQGERDKYGRLLAYVTLPNGTDFGEEMIRGGYAYEYTYSGAYTNQTLYKNAQSYASSHEQGLWAPGACGSTAKETTSLPTGNTNSGCDIKGNISQGGEKIYHVPGQQYYKNTVIDESKSERWFCTEGEAISAGWRPALR